MRVARLVAERRICSTGSVRIVKLVELVRLVSFDRIDVTLPPQSSDSDGAADVCMKARTCVHAYALRP